MQHTRLHTHTHTHTSVSYQHWKKQRMMGVRQGDVHVYESLWDVLKLASQHQSNAKVMQKKEKKILVRIQLQQSIIGI